MALKTISYLIDGKKKRIKVKLCITILEKATGLIFKKNSPPLLFIFNKNKNIPIHSFFCKPFRAIWLDEKMCATKIVDVKNWKLNISGKGKFLLEIPESLKNNKLSSINDIVDNRNI
ncbi:MAG: hypothetical protein ABIF18_01205 [archaeon]